MVGGRRGFALLEAVLAMSMFVVVLMGAAVLMQRHSGDVRAMYEERLAWETAAARMEILEAGGFRGLREGRREIEIDAPGWENLGGARCERIVENTGQGMHAVRVTVTWRDFRGADRSVEVRTMVRLAP